MAAEWRIPDSTDELLIDAYEHWLSSKDVAEGSASQDLVLATFQATNDKSTEDFFNGLEVSADGNAIMPEGVLSAFEIPTVGNFFSLLSTQSFAASTALEGFALVGSSVPLKSDGAFPPQPSLELETGWNEIEDTLVVTAVIDTDIAFANEAFRLPDFGSRILAFMDQSTRVKGTAVQNAATGLVLRKKNIDELIASNTSDGTVDELAVYRAANLVSFSNMERNALARHASHGTQVLHYASGHALYEDVVEITQEEKLDLAKRNPIIAVRLPDEAAKDTSGSVVKQHIMSSIQFILDEVGSLAKQREEHIPIILNFSFGNHADRHDGIGDLELYFDSLLRHGDVPNLIKPQGWFHSIVLPAGNSLQARGHAVVQGRQLKPEPFTLDWVVQPDDHTASFVQIWLPPGVVPDDGKPPIEIELYPPGQPSSIRNPDCVAPFYQELEEGGQIFARIYYQIHRPLVDLLPPSKRPEAEKLARCKVTIALQPTGGDNEVLAAHGVWKIKLSDPKGVFRATDRIDLWIERSDRPSGRSSGARQAYFAHPDYERFDEIGQPSFVSSSACPIKRLGTLSGIANGAQTVVVGGIRQTSEEADHVSYGSLGPAHNDALSTHPHRFGFDATAPADWSWARPAVLAIGNQSGSTSYCRGTSFAAPVVAAALTIDALQFDWAKPVLRGREQIRVSNASRDRVFYPLRRALDDFEGPTLVRPFSTGGRKPP